jgi:hypothetical protein
MAQVRQVEDGHAEELEEGVGRGGLAVSSLMEREINCQSGRGSRQLVIVPSTTRYLPSPVWSRTRPEKRNGLAVE